MVFSPANFILEWMEQIKIYSSAFNKTLLKLCWTQLVTTLTKAKKSSLSCRLYCQAPDGTCSKLCGNKDCHRGVDMETIV